MALVQCPECGSQVSSRALSCPQCGNLELPATCPECRQTAVFRNGNCPNCGATRATTPSSLAAAPAALALPEARVEDDGITKVVEDIRSFRLQDLLPYQVWLQDKPWNLVWVRWLTFFALFPLIAGVILNTGTDFQNTLWTFGVYFALLWGLIFFLCLKPGRLPLEAAVPVALFTVIIGIPLVLATQQAPVFRDLYAALDSRSDFIRRLGGFVLGVGVLEETAKALPLYWMFIHKRQTVAIRECAFLGCVSGLAFGVAEAVSYSIRYAMDLDVGRLSHGDYLTVQFIRLITLPMLHALWAGILGCFIGLGTIVREKAVALCLVGLAIVATLHGFYDVFSSGWAGVAIGVASLLVFVGYSRSVEHVANEIAARNR